MYAVIKTGGKQYRVEEGDTLRVEKIEVATGESVDFDQVLLVADGDDVKVGQPLLEGAKVTAEVVEQGRHKKIKIVKFRRRKHSRKQQGHPSYIAVVFTGLIDIAIINLINLVPIDIRVALHQRGQGNRTQIISSDTR